MFAADTATITVPSWVERIALPEYPAMPLLGYLLFGLGVLLLLIGYFAPIRKFLALLVAVALLAYYPLAWLFHWFLFRYDEKGRALREKTKFEVFLVEHTQAFDWVILCTCAFFGFLFLVCTVWATLRKRRRTHQRETASEDNPFAAPAPPPQPAARMPSSPPRPTAPRPASAPQAPQARKVPKRPPPPASDNPFNFT